MCFFSFYIHSKRLKHIPSSIVTQCLYVVSVCVHVVAAFSAKSSVGMWMCVQKHSLSMLRLSVAIRVFKHTIQLYAAAAAAAAYMYMLCVHVFAHGKSYAFPFPFMDLLYYMSLYLGTRVFECLPTSKCFVFINLI